MPETMPLESGIRLGPYRIQSRLEVGVGPPDSVDDLIMECLEGQMLAKRLERGPLPPDQVLKFRGHVADARGKAHRSGVIHRDLRTGNTLLPSAGAKLPPGRR